MSNRPDILHVIAWEKFVPGYIAFLERNFSDFDRHFFLILGWNPDYEIRRSKNTLFAHELKKPARLARLIGLTNAARKIVLHGLFDIRLLQLLTVQPWLLRKCYWAIWGGDLYGSPNGRPASGANTDEAFRRFVFKRVGHLVTYLDGDVELARARYGARGAFHRCLLYPSNLYHDVLIPLKLEQVINIQVGNSADPSNEHAEVFDALAKVATADTRIYVPLSYGDAEYAKEVIARGTELFGSRFVAITEFLPFERYLEFLGKIDIAIFNHRRQQAMGNTITLLGLGKTVILRKDVTQSRLFKEIGIEVYSLDDLDDDLLRRGRSDANRKRVREYFSEETLARQYAEIFR